MHACDWPQVKAVVRELGQAPAWYPGHNARYNAWKAMFPGAEEVAGAVLPPSKDFGPGALPMPFLINVSTVACVCTVGCSEVKDRHLRHHHASSAATCWLNSSSSSACCWFVEIS